MKMLFMPMRAIRPIKSKKKSMYSIIIMFFNSNLNVPKTNPSKTKMNRTWENGYHVFFFKQNERDLFP